MVHCNTCLIEGTCSLELLCALVFLFGCLFTSVKKMYCMKPWDTKNNDNRRKKARKIWVVLANDLLAVDFPSVRTWRRRTKRLGIRATRLHPFIAACGTWGRKPLFRFVRLQTHWNYWKANWFWQALCWFLRLRELAKGLCHLIWFLPRHFRTPLVPETMV